MSLAVVAPAGPQRGYVVVGYGVRDTSAFTGDRRDEAFGVFAVNDSLTRIWKTFEILPTPAWRDWELHIVRVAGDSVHVLGHSMDYGESVGHLERAYAWPPDRYTEP